jgi:hypothetical protein
MNRYRLPRSLSSEGLARHSVGVMMPSLFRSVSVVKPGGKLFLLCFSDKEPQGDGPRRVSQQELHDAFAIGWEIESIHEARFEVQPDLEDIQFSEGGPFAWFSVIRRV